METILVELILKGQEAYSAGMGAAATKTSAFGKKSSGMSKGMAIAGTAAIGATAAVGAFAVKLGVDSVKAYQESYKIGKQTEAVIKSTGGKANVSAAHIGKLSTSLSQMAGIDDESIQAGENMLLTFRNIRNESGKGNDVFDQSSKALLDLSVAMGKPPKTAAIALGKALNDPIKGMTALTRVGVTFSKADKATVTGLVKSGQRMKAQKIILKELNTEFRGSAKAQATGLGKLAVNYDNFQEGIGKKLMPTVNKAANALSNFITSGKGLAILKQVGTALAPIWNALKGAIGAAVTALQPMRGVFVSMLPYVKNLAVIVGGALVIAFKILGFALKILTPVIRVVATILRGWIWVLTQVTSGIVAVAKAIPGVASAIWKWMAPAVKRVVAIMRGVGGLLWGAMKASFAFVAKRALGLVAPFYKLGKSIVEGVVHGIRSAGAAILDAILELIPAPLRVAVKAALNLNAPAAHADTATVTNPGAASSVLKAGATKGVVAPINTKSLGLKVASVIPSGDTRVFLNGREIALAVGDDTANRMARR